MPRQRTDFVRQYFHFNADENSSQCRANAEDNISTNCGIEGNYDLQCRKVLQGSKVSNLKCHIKSHHPKIYEELLKREQKESVLKSLDKKTNNIVKKNPVVPSSMKEMIMRGLLHLVTLNGRPFSIVEDSGLAYLCGPAMREHNIRYNKHTIAYLVSQAAEAIKKELELVVKNTLISIKVDCVTRLSRTFLGIHVQGKSDGKPIVFTLPLREIEPWHTGQNLKGIILEELTKYNISTRQIYTVTSNSETNLLKSIEVIDEDSPLGGFDNIDDMKEEDSVSDVIVNEIVSANWNEDGIIGIPCAAHFLHQIVMDTLKISWDQKIGSYSDLIRKSRMLMNELRNQKPSIKVKKKKIPKISLEDEKGWKPTYSMLKTLLKMKGSTDSLLPDDSEELQISEEEWNTIDELRRCLEPYFIAMKKLEGANLTLTDTYKILNICHNETSAIEATFSKALEMNFLGGHETIMASIPMLSAIYLDPRFSFELTEGQREIAIENIMNIQRKLSGSAEEEDESVDITWTNTKLMNLDDETRYELMLKAKHQHLTGTAIPDFERSLRAFQDVPRLNSKNSVLTFWEENKMLYPSLYSVSKIVHTVPETQSSMERLLDQLRYVLDDRRDKITSENIENVLFVRSNFQHLKDSFFS